MPGKGLYMLLKKDTSFFFHQGLCQIVQMGSKWRSGSLCLLAILLLTIIDQRLAASIASQSRSLNKSIANSTTLAPQRKPNVTVLSSGTDQQIDSNSHFKPQISALIGRLVEHRKRDVHETNSASINDLDTQEKCTHDYECIQTGNTNITVNCVEGKCKMELLNGTSKGKVDQKKKKDNRSASEKSMRMLPVMIVLGIMFVGMCVAMNMFSRARFKNNRSIFNNPRILKVATANKQSIKQKRARRRKLFAQGRTQTVGHLEGNKVTDSDNSMIGDQSDSVQTVDPQKLSEIDLTTVVVTSSTEIIQEK